MTLVDPPPVARVAVGVVTYNNIAAQLRRLLGSVELAASRLDPGRHAVHFCTIDCGLAAEWPETRVPWHRLPPAGNLGFGAGMNVLMGKAFADPSVAWFLCVNPDGALHRSLLAEMLECSLRCPGSLIEARQFPEEHPKPYDPETGLTPWASGACLLIPRDIYQAIGGFDPNFFMYMEDVDYSWRARAAGFSVRVAPAALFAHSVLDRKPNLLSDRYYYVSARYLAFKWRRRREQARYEQVLRGCGFAEGALPPLPAPAHWARVPRGGRRVADFSHGFVFAPRRW